MQTMPKIFFGILLISFFSFPLRVYPQWQTVRVADTTQFTFPDIINGAISESNKHINIFPQSVKDEVVLDSSDCENILDRLQSVAQAHLCQQM